MTTQLICLGFIVFTCAAIALIFDLFNVFHEKQPKVKKKNRKKAFEQDAKSSLGRVISYYNGHKDFFMVQEVTKAKNILQETRRSDEYQKTVLTSVVLAGVGCIIGLLMGNVIAIPILALGLFMAPLWRLKLYQTKYKKYISAQLESSVSLITASYMRCDNIINSFEENIANTSELIRPYFEEFLAEYKVNPNMKACIRNLQKKVHDGIFEEWCDCLIKCYDNSEVKENLITISEKYSAIRIVQSELDAETASSLIEYVVMLGVLVLVYPMVKMLNSDWFGYYATFPGKITVAYSMAVGLYSIKKLLDLTTPVQFER